MKTEDKNTQNDGGSTNKQRKTKRIAKNSNHLRYITNSLQHTNNTDIIAAEKKFVFVIRGLRESFQITNQHPLFVGRFHIDNDPQVDIDLTRYGGAWYGVSRIHARITLDHNNHLYITDLNSTNGTLLAGHRLIANTRHLLHSGDKIALGTLTVKIDFSHIGCI